MKNIKPERLAEKLQRIRELLGLSQSQMSKHLGVEDTLDRSRISSFELGRREPSLLVLLRYARAARVHLDVLLADELDLPDKLPGDVMNKEGRRKISGRAGRGLVTPGVVIERGARKTSLKTRPKFPLTKTWRRTEPAAALSSSKRRRTKRASKTDPRSGPSGSGMEDRTAYKVVVNQEEQFSIWPADRDNQFGWNDMGKMGTKDECLAYMKEFEDAFWPLGRRGDSGWSESSAVGSHLDKGYTEDKPARRERIGVMSQSYVGEITMFAGNFAPAGWAFCHGQLLQISEHESLFPLIGTLYGGDGQTTFALPDLRGRSPMHMGDGRLLGEMGAVGFSIATADLSYGADKTEVGRSSQYLAMNFIISLFGEFPSQDSGGGVDRFMAEGRIFAFNFPPRGWALCNGQLLPINQNQALFALLGTFYGGNGQTTFALPDLRGLMPMHYGELVGLGKRAGQEDGVPSSGWAEEESVNYLVLNFCIALDGIFPTRD